MNTSSKLWTARFVLLLAAIDAFLRVKSGMILVPIIIHVICGIVAANIVLTNMPPTKTRTGLVVVGLLILPGFMILGFVALTAISFKQFHEELEARLTR